MLRAKFARKLNIWANINFVCKTESFRKPNEFTTQKGRRWDLVTIIDAMEIYQKSIEGPLTELRTPELSSWDGPSVTWASTWQL